MNWISVKDRLPYEYQEVLIKAEYGLVVGYYLDARKTDNKNWWWRGYRKIDEFELYLVTHWMPIPPPPTSDNKDCAVTEQAPTPKPSDDGFAQS